MKDMNIEPLITELEKLHARYELSKTVSPDYYEPGMMEYLDKSDGIFDENTGEILLRFEVKGTRYEGRTEQIEKIQIGEAVLPVREKGNIYNTNNFTFYNKNNMNLGNMPAELCNALAPLYDAGLLELDSAEVSYVEPISQRSRHAKQAVLFVELKFRYTA